MTPLEAKWDLLHKWLAIELDCPETPFAILNAIEMVQNEGRHSQKYIEETVPQLLERARVQATDQTIMSMRGAAVNCGQYSTCHVAQRFKTSNEEEAERKKLEEDKKDE